MKKETRSLVQTVAIVLSILFIVLAMINLYHQIDDHYPKYVLSMDKVDFSQNGIIHKNVIDFLLESTMIE